MTATVLSASCAGGVVLAGVMPVVGCEILSQGIGPSTGIVIIDGEKSYYVAKNSPDLAAHYSDSTTPLLTLIGELFIALTALSAAVTSLDSGVFATAMATISPKLVPIITKTTANALILK